MTRRMQRATTEKKVTSFNFIAESFSIKLVYVLITPIQPWCRLSNSLAFQSGLLLDSFDDFLRECSDCGRNRTLRRLGNDVGFRALPDHGAGCHPEAVRLVLNQGERMDECY